MAEELLAFSRQLADEGLTARAYCLFGLVALHQGDFQWQEEHFRQAVALAKAQTMRYEAAYDLMLLAISYKTRKNYSAATLTFQEALTRAQVLGSSRLALQVLSNLGTSYIDAGDFMQALDCLQQVLVQARQIRQKDRATFAQAGLGMLASIVGDYDTARLYLGEAQQSFVEIGDHVLAAQMLNMLADCCVSLGERAMAATYCQRALASPVAQFYLVQREAQIILGHLHQVAGAWSAARSAYETAYDLGRQTNLLTEWLPIQAYLASLSLSQGDAAAALVAIEPVLANFADCQWSTGQRPQESLLIAYQILVANHDPRAQATLSQAWTLVQEQLAKIEDARLRKTFLNNVPVNRQLAQLVEAGPFGITS